MLTTLLIAADLVTFVTTDTYELDSCIGEQFKLIKAVELKLPLHTERFKDLGHVDIQVSVNKSGDVVSSEVIHSYPRRIYDREAIRAVKGWKFNSSLHTERCFDIKFKIKPEISD